MLHPNLLLLEIRRMRVFVLQLHALGVEAVSMGEAHKERCAFSLTLKMVQPFLSQIGGDFPAVFTLR